MKIYGRTFSEVFSLLPWQYKMVVVTGIAFLIFIAIHFTFMPFRLKEAARLQGPLLISNIGWEYSIYDPSIAVDPVSRKAFIAFSNMRTIDDQKKHFSPHIRLASAEPPCENWMLTPYGLDARNDTVTAPDSATTIAAGVWHYETPTLIFDPDDPGKEWKLYAYRYIWTNDGNFQVTRRYGMITYVYSSDPSKGWSDEQWALGAKADWPPAPYGDLIGTKLGDLHPSLADITTYARPSAVFANGLIIMSLSAFTDQRSPDRVVMIASKDHGQTWEYLGTPLLASDAAKITAPEGLAFRVLGGATLLKQGDRIYLAAVFGGGPASGLGTALLPFEDIMKGALKRDEKTGAPVLLRHIPRQSNLPSETGGGYAAYNDGCKLGIVTGEHSGVKNTFQIFKTYLNPDGSKVE